jgi:hypothetical protein
MSNDLIEKQIKLAEAMGWVRINDEDMAWWPAPYIIDRIKKEYPDALCVDYVGRDGLPDPFTDANDDYAVLEWLREKYDAQEVINAFESMDGGNCCDLYEVGNYARAALKVINNEQ